MTQRIGIVACSAEGAALCYRTIALEGGKLLGPHDHPEVSMHTHALARYMSCKLAKAGADFLICPDNTIHQAFDLVEHRSPRPWLHIAQEVANDAGRRQFRRLGVLGTRYLMEGPVYPEKLKSAALEYRIPGPQERERINQIIMDELVNAQFAPRSLAYFQEVIRALATQGCDAVVLGCTEIPLLVTPDASSLPTLDSTRLLAKAAVKKAVGSA